jgi:ribonuclease Z
MYNVKVVHTKSSYGLILVHSNKWKFVYSGDTRPSQELIEAGKNATVLVHEATLEDSLIQDAIDKKHCTTKEAIESAIQ